MDRRQQKTRAAIFRAFTALLEQKNINSITVQEIIDQANIGRSTFYTHFETKDDLIRALCRELFDHIITTAVHRQDSGSLYFCNNPSYSVTCHILQHLMENDNSILTLLSCESNGIFLRYFKAGMEELVRTQILRDPRNPAVPQAFLVSHISGAFVEMVQWWLEGSRQQTPEELDAYFHAVIDPIFAS